MTRPKWVTLATTALMRSSAHTSARHQVTDVHSPAHHNTRRTGRWALPPFR